jgi:nucleoid DNA-binding protein
MRKNGQIDKEISSEALDTAIIDVLLRGENIVIPEFGYLELTELGNRRTVLFKPFTSANAFIEKQFDDETEHDDSVLYSHISEPLKDGKVVALPKFGTFRPAIKDDGKVRVSFIPSAYLRELLNEGKAKATESVSNEVATEADLASVIAQEPAKKEIAPIHKTAEQKPEVETPEKPKQVIVPAKPNATKQEANAYMEYNDTPRKRSFLRWLITLLIALVVIVLLYVVFSTPKNTKQPVTYQSDSINLPDLANKYYGNSVFWVYIYDANKEKLHSPVNVPRGVELIIPDLSDYNVDINDSLEVKRATLRAELILKQK